jgi:hypothetical protein
MNSLLLPLGASASLLLSSLLLSGGFFVTLPLTGAAGFFGVLSSSDSVTDGSVLARQSWHNPVFISLMQFLQ